MVARTTQRRVMNPGNRRFVRTALAILGLMALATATVWIVLFMFVRPARGDTVDARMFYVIDGDTLALAGERIRLLGIDAPETREARCERERVAGYETKARVVDLLRFGRVVDIRRHGHDQYGRTLAHIVIDGRDLGEQLVREKLALPYRSGAEAKAARLAQWCVGS
jgi:micrococcal nuclease